MRASITRLGGRLKDLQGTADRPDTPKHAQQLLEKLKSLDGEIRELHYEVIDLIDEGGEDTIEAEQVILDKHDDDVAALTVHLESLLVATASVPDIRKSLTRRLALASGSEKN